MIEITDKVSMFAKIIAVDFIAAHKLTKAIMKRLQLVVRYTVMTFVFPYFVVVQANIHYTCGNADISINSVVIHSLIPFCWLDNSILSIQAHGISLGSIRRPHASIALHHWQFSTLHFLTDPNSPMMVVYQNYNQPRL